MTPQPDAKQRLEEIIDQINDLEEPSEALLLSLREFRGIDIADEFFHIKSNLRFAVFDSFDDEIAAEVLGELDDILAIQILRELTPERTASILNLLPPDEGADMIALSEEEDQPQILTHLDQDLAEQIRDLSTYSPESAGGLMTSNFVSVLDEESVRSVLIKVKTSEEAETINYIYIVDKKGKLEGVVSVRDLLQARLNQTVSSIMEKDVISVPLEMDQEEVTRVANKYHFHSMPVVDLEGSLKGIVTFDDLMEVLEEESSEDMYKMAGEMALHPTHQPVIRRIMARLPWLLVTLGGTIIAAGIIKAFEAFVSSETDISYLSSLENLGEFLSSTFSQIDDKWKFLLCFLPMIGGMAGNVGLQSSTVMVRGLATGEIESSFFLKILSKEILIAAAIGLISGVMIGCLILGLFQNQENVGFVVAVSLFAAILSAAVLGTFIPFLCLIIRVDPAYASGPLLTTLNDIFGFLIFFWIAYLMLYP